MNNIYKENIYNLFGITFNFLSANSNYAYKLDEKQTKRIIHISKINITIIIIIKYIVD